MIDAAIRAWLLTQGTVTAIVGQKVFVDDVPEGTLDPYLIVAAITNDENVTLDGRPAASGAMCTDEVDIDSKARTRYGADLLASAVAALGFRDFKGSLGAGLETVLAVESQGLTKAKDPAIFADDAAFFRSTLSFNVFYRPLA